MIVILEGVDGSGKTTLLKTLNEQFGYEILIVNNKEDLDEWLNDLIDYSNKTVITDRSFIGDLVYRLWDNKPRRGMSLNAMCLILLETKIIHCESGTEFNDSMLRGEDFVVTKKDSDIIKSYYNIFMKTFEKFLDAKICKYNWHDDSIDKVIKFIEEA